MGVRFFEGENVVDAFRCNFLPADVTREKDNDTGYMSTKGKADYISEGFNLALAAN